MTSRYHVLLQLAVWTAASALLTGKAHAQIPATATWQVSLNNGSTWQTGSVTVGPSQPYVDVRVLIGWDGANIPPGPTFLYEARFDGVVNNAGASDQVSNMLVLRAGLLRAPSFPLMAHRMGPLIKIDATNDLLPPGVGFFGISPDQTDILGQVPNVSNPVPAFSYRLALDGTLGTRELTGAFNTYPQTSNPWAAIRADVPGLYVLATSITQQPASIEVIPAPAAVWVGVGALCVAARRRR
jgi:hypothetical protein